MFSLLALKARVLLAYYELGHDIYPAAYLMLAIVLDMEWLLGSTKTLAKKTALQGIIRPKTSGKDAASRGRF